MRTLKTGRLTSALGSSYFGGKIFDRFRKEENREGVTAARHQKNARRLVDTMAELRGPIMKIGQLLSTHGDVLPDTYSEMLSSLQSQAPAMPYDAVRKVIVEELDKDPEELFARFEKQAHAAASIGQVHRAWLHDGTPVAVKVQYPGATTMVEGDLKNLEVGIKLVKRIASDLLRNKKLDFTPIYEEIAEHLRQETDACREAFNAQLLYTLFEDDPDIIIPKPHLAYSGLRVITYTFIEGENISAFMARDDLDDVKRERVATLLSRAFWRQLTHAGILHADPHPGNYFITPDLKLALLDFGCVKIFSPTFIENFTKLALGYIELDDDAVRDAVTQLDMLDDDSDFEDVYRIGHYFCTGLDKDDVFSFVNHDYIAEGRELIEHFLSTKRIPKAQKDFLFLSRVVLGYFEYFSRLQVEMNFYRQVMPFLERGWKGRSVDIPTYYLDHIY